MRPALAHITAALSRSQAVTASNVRDGHIAKLNQTHFHAVGVVQS